MSNSIDKEISDLLWRLEYIGKYTSKMREEKSIEITKLTEVEKLDAIYQFKQEISNYEKNKKSIRETQNIGEDGLKFLNILFFGHFNKTARAFIWWLIGIYTTFRIFSVIIIIVNDKSPSDKFIEYAFFLIFFMSLSFVTYKIKSLKKWIFKLIPSNHEKWISFKSSINNNERISLSLLFGYFFFNLFLLIIGGGYGCYKKIWFIESDFRDIYYYDITDFLIFNFIPIVIFYCYFSLKPKP